MTAETRMAIGDLAEMLTAMERTAVVRNSSAYTSRELMGELNIGERRCMRLIRQGIEAGAIRSVRKHVMDIAGRPAIVPAYEPVAR